MIIYYLFIFFGFFLDYINNLIIKATIRRFMEIKKRGVLFLSFIFRLIVLFALFIIMANFNIKYLYFTFLGLFISKMFLLTKRVLQK